MAATMDQAAVQRRSKEIETEYLSSLADLNVNSKPLINMLTILAEENLDYAPIIVNAVEKHLAKVQPEFKLPILYLVDSIVKNVGKQYQQLFSQVIVNMFCGVFETVNEKVREKMFSLRQTWNEVFPQSKLYALDIKINSIDPGWPITAQLKTPKSPAIHVNPMFLKNQQIPEPNLDMQQQLRDKQRELLELQAKKLELELIATKKRIEEQEKLLVAQTASVTKEPVPDLKRPATVIGSNHVPPPRGRIAPPNAAMINLAKSRDPRLARQQAQLAAQMVAASTNSTPTMVGGTQIPPHNPIVLDQSGKPVSIRERLGRIPKRTDPRIKPSGTDVDRRKPSSTATSSSVNNSSSPSHKSRSENDASKKREKKDELSPKSARSSSSKPSSSDKKKLSADALSPKSSSPLKKKTSSLSEKSPSRSEKTSPKSREGKVSKGNKSSTRRPGDIAKNSEDSSVSPSSSSENLMPVANESKDVDLRLLIPEKKLKLEQQQPPQHPQAKLVSKPLPDQKKALGEAVDADNVPSALAAVSRDVDLRIPPPGLLKDVSDSVVVSSTAGLPIVAPVTGIESGPSIDSMPAVTTAARAGSPSETAVKKRPSNHKLEEPVNKKPKSEKIDGLFGSEDVDLRKLAGPMHPIEPLPPPPPIISEATRPTLQDTPQVESLEKQLGAPSSKAALEAVRAKIAEATKNKDRDKLGRPLLYNKLSDDPVERRRSLNQPKAMDVDLRQQQPQFPPADPFGEDNSQDGMNANIKTIVAQAQEQMEKGEITPEQYNILMKQVIQLNETQKIRQAQRMEMMKRQQIIGPMLPDDNANSHSGEEMASFSPNINDDGGVKPNVPAIAGGGPVVSNDFRGKITPVDTTSSKVEPQFGNSGPIGDIRIRDPRRPTDARFNPQWGIRGPMPGPNAMPGVVGPPMMNQRLPGPMLNPWDQTPFAKMNQNVVPPPPMAPRFPPVPLNNGPQSNMLMPGVPKQNESVRTINIDGIQREIRFYDDIAVIFMSWDEPKEIGFQKGSRMVVVDDRDSFELSFNECYKAITIEGKVYQMKLGAPTRELYIDDRWYECYFGDPPTNIVLDGINRVFKISGPAPQVKIGNSRNDLVAGKINMIVNAEIIIPVFLDSQIQTFEIYGQMHRLQFADFLLTVIIDDQPFLVEYGGLPKVFKLRGKDFYIRFTAVPKVVVPGRVYIRDMIRTPLHRDLRTPPRDQNLLIPFVQPMNSMMSSMAASSAVPSLFPAGASMQPKHSATVHPTATGLDYLTNLMPHSTPHSNVSNNLAGYQIQAEDKPLAPPVAAAPAKPASGGLNLPILQNLNIDELYAKIVAAGIIGKTTTTAATTAPSTSTSTTSSTASKLEKALEEEIEDIEPVYLNKPETLKRRQSAIVAQLFLGMQCSSCGVRFPPEQTMKYSQHLDWHFRQNRRDRDSARKAHSRKWYYDVSDWIQYEEIEDLEEREKNWFEAQQTEQLEFNGDGEMGSGRPGAETPPPSCPAGSDEASKRCHMCHDEFQQFYNEETEEWHLKNAIRVEECTYHPLCYEDYKASLTLDETAMNATNEEGDESKTDDDVKVKQEAISDADDTVKEITIDDDDDVIVLPPSEEVVTEIPDDDDVETVDSHSTADDTRGATSSVTAVDDDSSKPSTDAAPSSEPPAPKIIETRIDDDIAIQEPTIERIDVNDLDDSDAHMSAAAPAITDECSQMSVKVKEEPKDDDEEDVDEEDELFEDVGTIESSMVENVKEADTVDLEAIDSPPSPPLESTSQVQLKPSIDGNVEMQDNLTTGVITNRIKINITKAKTTTAATTGSTTTSSSYSTTGGGSSIAVLISGGGGSGAVASYDNCNDDLLYGNLDDIHGGHHDSNSSSMMVKMHEDEELEQDANNKGPVPPTNEETTDIDYDLKPSLRGIVFTRQPRVENGFETSGLCSIM